MRLIDGERLVRENMPLYKEAMGTDIGHGFGMMLGEIIAAPTVDAVPVVRCVNCIHYGAEASAFDAWTPFCLKHKLTTFQDDFCSYGERKDGEQCP